MPLYKKYLLKWEDFKDLMRSVLKKQPGWSDVEWDKTTGWQTGVCEVTNVEEVDPGFGRRLFRYGFLN